MDLNHGLAFAGSSMKIYAGDYESCQDADLVLIAAGVAQKQGETRLDLLKRNTQVFSFDYRAGNCFRDLTGSFWWLPIRWIL